MNRAFRLYGSKRSFSHHSSFVVGFLLLIFISLIHLILLILYNSISQTIENPIHNIPAQPFFNRCIKTHRILWNSKLVSVVFKLDLVPLVNVTTLKIGIIKFVIGTTCGRFLKLVKFAG